MKYIPHREAANLTLKMCLIFIHYALSHLFITIAAFGFLPVVVAVLPNQTVLSYSKIIPNTDLSNLVKRSNVEKS